jgi:Uma2 family endonuclease
MSTDRAPVRMTYEELQRLPDDGQRHELVDGVLVVTPSPASRHQRIVAILVARLLPFAEEHELGSVFPSPLDVVLSRSDVVQPDVLFVAKSGAARVEEHGIEGPPDLVVEVVSQGSRRRDAITKRQLYGRYGVREYWLVDPETDSVKVFRLSGALEPVQELTAQDGGRLTTPLLPGFELPLVELFAQ